MIIKKTIKIFNLIEFIKFENSTSLFEKLKYLKDFIRIIGEIISLYQKSKTGADDLMPLTIYNLLKLSPEKLYSNLK